MYAGEQVEGLNPPSPPSLSILSLTQVQWKICMEMDHRIVQLLMQGEPYHRSDGYTRAPAMVPRVQSPRDYASEIHDGRSGSGTGFAPSLFGFPLLIIIPRLLHTHLSPLPQACNSSGQAAHYHIFRL